MSPPPTQAPQADSQLPGKQPAPETTHYTKWKEWNPDDFGLCSIRSARYFAWHLARCHPTPVRDALELGSKGLCFVAYRTASRPLVAFTSTAT